MNQRSPSKIPASDIPFPTLSDSNGISFSDEISNQDEEILSSNLCSIQYPRSNAISSTSTISNKSKTPFPHLSRKSSLSTSKTVKIKLANQAIQDELCESSTQTEDIPQDASTGHDGLPRGRVSAERISQYLRNLDYSDYDGESSSTVDSIPGALTPPLTPSSNSLSLFHQLKDDQREFNHVLAYGGGIPSGQGLDGTSDSDASSDELVSEDFNVINTLDLDGGKIQTGEPIRGQDQMENEAGITRGESLQIQPQRRASNLADVSSIFLENHGLGLSDKSSHSSSDSNQTQIACQGPHPNSLESLSHSGRTGATSSTRNVLEAPVDLEGLDLRMRMGMTSRFSWDEDASDSESEDSDAFGTAMGHSHVFEDGESRIEEESGDRNRDSVGMRYQEDESEASSLRSSCRKDHEAINTPSTPTDRSSRDDGIVTSTPPSRPLSSHSQLRALTSGNDSGGDPKLSSNSPPGSTRWNSRSSPGRTSPFQRLNFSTFKKALGGGGGDGKSEENHQMEISRPFQPGSDDSPSSPKTPTPRRRLRSFILLGSPNVNTSPSSNRCSTSDSTGKGDEALEPSKPSNGATSVYNLLSFSKPNSPTSPKFPSHPKPQAPISPSNVKSFGVRRARSSSLLLSNFNLEGSKEAVDDTNRTRAIRLSFDEPDPFARQAMYSSPTPSSPVYQLSTLENFDFNPPTQAMNAPSRTPKTQLKELGSPILSLSPTSSQFGSVNSSSSHIVIDSDKESRAAPKLRDAKRIRKVSSTGSLPKNRNHQNSSHLSDLKYTKSPITPKRESSRPFTSPNSQPSGSNSKKSSIAYSSSPSWKRNDWRKYEDEADKSKSEVGEEKVEKVEKAETQFEGLDGMSRETVDSKQLMGGMRKSLNRRHHSAGADLTLAFNLPPSSGDHSLTSSGNLDETSNSDSFSDSGFAPTRPLSHAKASSKLRAFYTGSGSTWKEEIKRHEAKKLEHFRKHALDNLTALESKSLDLDLSLKDFGEGEEVKEDGVRGKGEAGQFMSPNSPSEGFNSNSLSNPIGRSRSNSTSKVLLQYQKVRTLLGESLNRNKGLVDFNGEKEVTHSKSLDFSTVFPSKVSMHKRQSPSMPINIFESNPSGRKSLVRRSVATQTDFTLIASDQGIDSVPTFTSTNSQTVRPRTRNFTSSPKVKQISLSRSTKSFDGLSQFDNQRFSGDYLNQEDKDKRRTLRDSVVEGPVGDGVEHRLRGVKSFGARLKSFGKRVRLNSRSSRIDFQETSNINNRE